MHQKNVIFVIIWYFLDKGFKFESCLSNGCLYLIQKVIDFNDLAIVSVKRNDYRIMMIMMSSFSLSGKSELYFYHFFFCWYKRWIIKLLTIKKNEETLLKKNKK